MPYSILMERNVEHRRTTSIGNVRTPTRCVLEKGQELIPINGAHRTILNRVHQGAEIQQSSICCVLLHSPSSGWMFTSSLGCRIGEKLETAVDGADFAVVGVGSFFFDFIGARGATKSRSLSQIWIYLIFRTYLDAMQWE
jgi:hypothetical protein